MTISDGCAVESPLTQAKAIITPLMVVQGKNDPRVNIRESDQIVAAVRDNGKPGEYLVAPDEGHGFARPHQQFGHILVDDWRIIDSTTP